MVKRFLQISTSGGTEGLWGAVSDARNVLCLHLRFKKKEISELMCKQLLIILCWSLSTQIKKSLTEVSVRSSSSTHPQVTPGP